MADNKHTQHPLPDLTNPEMRHEHRDVNVWVIGKVAIGLVLVTIASVFLMFGVFHYFEQRENASQAPPPTVTSIDSRKLPAEPNLIYNENEAGNLKEIRDAEDRALNGYGWVDQPKGVVKIPIDRAIDLLAQRGLPARPASALQIPRPSAGESQAK